MGKIEYFIIAATITLTDQVSKWAVRTYMSPGRTITIKKNLLKLRHINNPGGAFGVFSDKESLFLIFSLGVVLFLSCAVFLFNFRHNLALLGMALILGGAGGNLIDRLIRGRVTDFIQVANLPIFNVADVAIVAGAALIIVVIIGGGKL